MFTLKQSLLVISLAALLLVVIGCSDDENNNLVGSEPSMDIVETAVADGRFTTLVAALQAADLVDALKAEGPLTVFAPTDDAFNALPEGTIEALLADTDALTAILTYHVVPGKVTAEEMVKLATAPTLNGDNIEITVTDGKVKVDNANVIITDIETTNGIIHVIDAVIIPGTESSTSSRLNWHNSSYPMGGGWIANAIVSGELNWLTRHLPLYVVARLGGLTTLTTAVKLADLKTTLIKDGPFTIFAPTNDAFDALPEGTLSAVLADKTTLTNILLYHVTPGRVNAAQVVNLTEANMVNGGTVTITVGDGVMVNDVNVIATDIMSRNGVIHLIDGVLLP